MWNSCSHFFLAKRIQRDSQRVCKVICYREESPKRKLIERCLPNMRRRNFCLTINRELQRRLCVYGSQEARNRRSDNLFLREEFSTIFIQSTPEAQIVMFDLFENLRKQNYICEILFCVFSVLIGFLRRVFCAGLEKISKSFEVRLAGGQACLKHHVRAAIRALRGVSSHSSSQADLFCQTKLMRDVSALVIHTCQR